MKLSMWMIANRLNNFDLDINIKSDAPAILKSARRAYATNCVHIFQSGNDVICNGEGNYIRIKDINVSQAFEIVQSIFDFYDDWHDNIFYAISKYDFNELLNYCYYVFNNPIILMDANCKVIAIGKQYEENDVDSEWKHLKKYNYSSIDAIKYLRDTSTYGPTFYEQGPKFYNFTSNQLRSNCLSSSIYYNELFCGRINVLEKDRLLNYGDYQLLEYIVTLIKPYISTLALSKDSSSICNVFLSLINKENININDYNNQLKYIDWDKNDNYRICILYKGSDSSIKSLLTMYCGIIENNLNYSKAFIKNNNLIVIFNESKIDFSKGLNILKDIINQCNMKLSISNSFTGLNRLNVYYNQLLYTINSQNTSCEKSSDVIYFYNHALNYIIESKFNEDILYACHPNILKLWEYDEKSNNNDKIDTLYTYLTNERSITKTSQLLFLHKNTLIYRMKKIEAQISCNLNDSYTREYIIFSIKVLKLYTNKYKRNSYNQTQNLHSV